ncbi:AfsR/SARP family transcriptional regulator [Actinokineospora enzanensis]|uniref:AfsR/SARP family transcriptional regulator n=1 Tax=Actinokineospora enzanensis TaxID=155975 RepID=UPI00146A9A8B|nr:AfsR/SARP family transcriptional regulator [Actinokineospora enzanensis]
MGIRFRLLGPIQVLDGENDITPKADKQRVVLTMLALYRGRVVRTEELIDELWGNNPPRSALATLQTYVYKIRRLLPGPGPGADLLDTLPRGYRASIAAEDLDVAQFERLAMAGETALRGGQVEQAATLCAQALRLWRGPALSDLSTGATLSAHAMRLAERKLRTLEVRIEADLRLDRHRELISELKELTIGHPLHEEFHGDLMLALHRSNRQLEALAVFQRLREAMIEQAGLEPSVSLQELHGTILAAGGAPAVGVPASALVGAREPVVATPITPAQLPPDTADYVVPDDLVRQATQWLRPRTGPPSALRVLTVNGMPGVGKTAFAVHLAHRLREHFPDGQFFADLRGTDDNPAEPADILARFLRAVQLTHQVTAADLAERATAFRSWSSGRRVLVVLDDARSYEQVRPLLPGDARCAVIVTSSAAPPTQPGAHSLRLAPMCPTRALTLLAGIVGTGRVTRERADAERLLARFGHLPLAIRCLGARLLATGVPIWQLRDQVEAAARPLDHLRFGDINLRARLDASYRLLPPQQRAAFHGLADAVPGVGTTPAELRTGAKTLDALVARNLADIVPAQDCTESRYGLHPVLADYARERVRSVLPG